MASMASNKDNFTRFWIIPCKAEALRKISRFKLEKAFTSAYGLLRKCSTLPSGGSVRQENKKHSDFETSNVIDVGWSCHLLGFASPMGFILSK